MHLVINIPCYNEEKHLPSVLESLPTEIAGIDKITVQVVDDGSSDNTSKIAESYNCTVIRHRKNKGLGKAFKSGLNNALILNADIFVNTDADNQYPSRYIKDLVQPIISREADIVIGNRSPWKVKHFSPLKRILQRIGNLAVRQIAETDVPDMISGFRAYSRESLYRLNITTKFSYVLDTIVQAGKKDLKIVSIDIETNPPTRESRLFSNIFEHMQKSAANILRLYLIYQPFKTFTLLSLILAAPGIGLVIRFLIFYFHGFGSGNIQSLIIAVIFMLLAAVAFIIGIVAGLIGINRSLTEDILYWQKKALYPQDKDQ